MTPTSRPSARTPPAHPEAGRPWWRYPMVWLVVSGPLAVVVASIVTAAIAIRGADPVLMQELPEARQAVATDPNAPTAPAMQARNHNPAAK